MISSNAVTATQKTPAIKLKKPDSTTGWQVHQLIQQSPPLDTNSVYCNLLQCSHFANTSVAAWQGEQLVGFISGYIPPEKADCLFIWQVAVSPAARRQRLASKMLQHILQRPTCANVTFLETTITADNKASWALFESLARSLNAATTTDVLFDKTQHFNGQHDSEHLLRIGPFQPMQLSDDKHPESI